MRFRDFVSFACIMRHGASNRKSKVLIVCFIVVRFCNACRICFFFLYAVLMILSPGCSASPLVGICLAVCALHAGPCVAGASILFSSLWVSASGAGTYALRVTEMPSMGIIPSVCYWGGAHLPGLCLMLQPSWWALVCMSLHVALVSRGVLPLLFCYVAFPVCHEYCCQWQGHDEADESQQRAPDGE